MVMSGSRGTVVLLHGFGGLPIMYRPLARMLRRVGFDARELGYDSWGLSLEAICDRLLPRLARIPNDDPIHFVAHSMGGLVARALIHEQRPARLGHVVMLGTPNAGSEIADFLMQWPVLKPILGKAAPALITRRQSATAELIGTIDYSVGIIAGDKPMMAGAIAHLIPGPNDGKVSVASTRLPEAADHIVLPLSHGMLPYHPLAQRQVRHFMLHGRFEHDADRDPA
jgi:pimeloyl-ACP methyl ester carboxylesterase